MKTSRALQIIGGLSNTKKMDCFSYGLPALECKTGSKLRKIPGSTCYNCYAMKGCYVFPDVKKAQYRRLKSLKRSTWVRAMATAINSKKSNLFRWHDSGDVQSVEHMQKILTVCRLTPGTKHWLPTQERPYLPAPEEVPSNLIIRLSGSKVDGPRSTAWTHTSSVVTKGATCPAPAQDGKCRECRKCWNKRIKNVSYGKH